MKSFLCLLVAVSSACAATPEYEAKVVSSLTSCALEHKVEMKEVISLFRMDSIPETPESKCVTGCFFKKMDYLNDMNVDWSKIKAHNSAKYESPELVEKADQVIDSCAKVVTEKTSDMCQVALPAMKCISDGTKKFELPKPDLKFS